MFVRVPRAFSQGLWAAVAATLVAVPALATGWLGVMVQPADRDLEADASTGHSKAAGRSRRGNVSDVVMRWITSSLPR